MSFIRDFFLIVLSLGLLGAFGCSGGASSVSDAGSDGGGDGNGGGDPTYCEFRECGSDNFGGNCGTCDSGLMCSDHGQCYSAEEVPLVVFFFDQNLDAIVRLEDLNSDGEMHTEGEATLYWDSTNEDERLGITNSLGMVATSPYQLFATDNFDPENVVSLFDENRDGDAFDGGEATEFFDGRVSAEFSLIFPFGMWQGQDGAFYLVDNNAKTETNPEAVYRLDDADNSGSIDSSEVSVFRELEAANVDRISTWDVRIDSRGYAFHRDDGASDEINILYRSNREGVLEEYMYGDWLYSATQATEALILYDAPRELEYLRKTDELVMLALSFPADEAHILAVRDTDESGEIDDLSELRVLWDQAVYGQETTKIYDIAAARDDSLVIFTTDQILRATDRNGDGDMHDPGETTVVFSVQTATDNGMSVTGDRIWRGAVTPAE